MHSRRQSTPRLTASLLAAALALSARGPARAEAPEPAAAPSDPADETRRAEAAKQAYADGDFKAAARTYEALWSSTKRPKYIYNAGLAREAAGHGGVAAHHWRRFLASPAADISPTERANLQARVDAAVAENPQLELNFEPAGAVGPTTALSLQPPPELAAEGIVPVDLRDPIATDIDEDMSRFRTSLEPGTWTLSITGLRDLPDQTITLEIPPGASRTIRPIVLSARVPLSVRTTPRLWLHPGADLVVSQGGAPVQSLHFRGSSVALTAPEGPVEIAVSAAGYLPVRIPLTLDPEAPPAPINVQLEVDRSGHDYRRTRLGLGLGLGLSGMALTITGSALAVSAAYDVRDKLSQAEIDTSLIKRRDDMSFIAGAGGGLLLSSGVAAFRPRSPRLWLVGTSAGGVLAAAGLLIVNVSARRLASDGKGNPPAPEVRTYSDRTAAGNVLLGLGSGLLAGSVATLVTYLVQHRRTRHTNK